MKPAFNFNNDVVGSNGKFTDYWQRALSVLLQNVPDNSNIADALLRTELAAAIPAQIEDTALLSEVLAAPPVPSRAEDLRSLVGDPPLKAEDVSPWITDRPVSPTIPIIALIQDTAANLANYPAGAYPNAVYVETDTQILRRSDGTAWTQVLAPALLIFLVADNGHPALKRSGAGLQVRLADDSGYTWLEVLDQAYGAGWAGSLQVPTKNATYTKIQTFIGSPAYTPANVTPQRSFDVTAPPSMADIANTLGTLIADLQGKLILS